MLNTNQMNNDEDSCVCTSLQFRFVRDNDNSLRDDVFILNIGSHSDFKVVHRSPLNNNKTTTYFKDSYDVIVYFKQIINLMLLDDEKYLFFQFDAPGYPTIMVKFSQLKEEDIVKKFEDVLDAVMTNWPSYCESI
jgi:hypothetical protein